MIKLIINFITIIVLLCAISTIVSGTAATGSYTATFNPTQNWGVWEGFGTSLAWWAQTYGNNTVLADIMFTTQNVTYFDGTTVLPGLGLNIVRYNAGASTWVESFGRKMVQSPEIKRSRQVEGYWLNWASEDPQSDSWNWAADPLQRNMMAMARDRGVQYFELFSNSPIWWMTYNLNPSGADLPAMNNLETWNYQNHTVYMATIAQYAAENWNISFTSIDPFNEPSGDFWIAFGSQEGCHFDVEAQKDVIPYMRKEIDSRRLTAMLAASDENNYRRALDTWNSFDSSIKQAVDKVNVHGYELTKGPRSELYEAVNSQGKVLWNSEYGEGDITGLSLATNLLLDLAQLHPTAWVYWQVLDISGWGMIEADENANPPSIGAVATKYYVLAQFSRHIRHGMTIIQSSDGNSVAAFDSVNNKLVIVSANIASSAQTITFNLSKFTTVNGGYGGIVPRWATETNGNGDLYSYHEDTYIQDKMFSVTFNSQTVQTFEIEGVYL
ncbi:secreted endo-beta-1,6-galactanase [Heterostelium album PN500]|uniref:Secreted endo-beta-1,6-galactanase n=1 Tax=Heterostelium pallidum (strain ATCC 26659 / Pp 5 / PN500) TaxID=670386 RepID=D3BKG5_HETP5|nr:secreted endo-beta-1,6-galactanase [Heterostelium album PN500]EFA78395.1 secreted endo-beta-1,6-galactanase [Heterostelium album PN500]|eukprot:XP_020430520.1 secreted endo-beta-1,6-galactanase [Heterostelium album PN500]